MLTAMIVGNRISMARKEKNLSQALLAQALSVSAQAVGKWERGESMPDIMTFERLAEVLGVDLNYFSESFSSDSIRTGYAEAHIEDSIEAPHVTPQKKRGWNMSEGNWVDADFSGLGHLHEKFASSNLQRCLFIGSEMSGLFWKSNYIDACDFSESDIRLGHMLNSHIINSTFRHCSLQETEFTGSYMKDCDFTEADFTGAVFDACALLKNNMSSAIWNRTTFHNTSFADMVLSGIWTECSFDNCAFSKVTFQNATLTNTFFKAKSLKKLRFVDCRADKLTYAFLKNGKADLSGVSLLTE